MEKTKQGTKKKVLWKATCNECESEFTEEVGALKIEEDRDGQMARSYCPDCKVSMFFYPITRHAVSTWGDH